MSRLLALLLLLPALALADDPPAGPGPALDALDKALAGAKERMPRAACERAAAYSRRVGGQALLVIERGARVFEAYYNGYQADTPHRLASGTKSFSGVLAAKLITDGVLSGWDERVSATITEWKGDPRRERITVRQLLGLSSGIDTGKPGRPPSYDEAIKAKAVAEPGKRFAYGPFPFQIFGELVRRKLVAQGLEDPDPLRYLQRTVLDKIGMKIGSWRRTGSLPNLPSGAFLTAREWAKLGVFLLARGRHGEEQLIAWDALRPCFQRSPASNKYGLTFWLAAGQKGIPKDTVFAAGAGKQRLYLIPSRQLIVVQLAEAGKAFSDVQLLAPLLERR